MIKSLLLLVVSIIFATSNIQTQEIGLPCKLEMDSNRARLRQSGHHREGDLSPGTRRCRRRTKRKKLHSRRRPKPKRPRKTKRNADDCAKSCSLSAMLLHFSIRSILETFCFGQKDRGSIFTVSPFLMLKLCHNYSDSPTDEVGWGT